MSNVYLKIAIEKNWRSQTFDFISLKNLSPGQVLGSLNSGRYYWILKLLVAKCVKEVRVAFLLF